MLRVADDLGGAAVQCPRCGTTFEGPPETVDVIESPLEPIPPTGPPPPRGVPPVPKPMRPVLLSSTTEPVSSSSRRPDDEWLTCSVCRTREPEGTRRCSVCGNDLTDAPRPGPRQPARRDYEPDRGTLISALGTISVLFGVPGLCGVFFWPFTLASAISAVVGISAVVMASGDLDLMERNIMDPQGRDSTLNGKSQAWIGTVLGLIGVTLGGVIHLMMFLRNSF